MKAISLWRPWDLFVLLGWKSIETRTHKRFKSLAGTTIAIHSAKRLDPNWKLLTEQWLSGTQQNQIARSILEGGHVHGIVEVWAHRRLGGHDSWAALIDCSECTRYGLDLDHARLLENPIEVRGRQGIFDVPISEAAVRAAGGRSNYGILKQKE